MKKLFLIPLLACFSCVMAFATVRTAGSYAELQSALTAAVDGDEIQLTADIAYPKNGEGLINITKSITLNGQGHTISGYGSRGGQPNVISINYNNSSYVTVELKNLNIYSTQYRPLETRGYITKLTLDNVNITSTGGTYNPQGLTMGGYQTSEPYAQLVIKDSKISATASGYPVIFWNPAIVTATNSHFNGYCALYFKTDSKHSVVNADACNFDAPNVHSGASNAFAVFALEDGDMTFNLNNCSMNAEQFGDQTQSLFSLSEWTLDENRGVGAINITLSGDNSHFNSSANILDNGYWCLNPDGDPQYGPKSEDYLAEITAEQAVHVSNINFTITGGTYSVNPKNLFFKNDYYFTKEEEVWVEHYNSVPFTILPTDTVQEINQGGVTLYRVVKKAQEKTPGVMYDLNDFVPVEGEDYGNNPVSSFDLSTGTDMTLNQETTTAGYVQVSDKDNGVDSSTPTTVTVGTPSQDQTLVINNGLDVQGDSKVVVEAGSTLQIGEGGINTEKPENIIIEADENGAASLLLDPTITVNQTPNLTVRMTAKQIGRNGAGDFYWHRFAMPVAATITSWDKEGTLVAADPEYTVQYPTYIYGWNYEENKWKNLPGVSSMVPLQGYTLTLASDYIHLDGAGKVVSEGTAGGNLNALQDVVYTFKGNLVGNTPQPLNFQAEGFNFFGNSYTGYMDVLKLIEGIQSNNVEGTVYMWCNDPDDEDGNYQSYVGVPLYKLSNAAQRARLADWQKEVSPMQTFILRLRGADSADENVNYASAIWGNPRYGNTTTSSPAPRRAVAAINEDTYMEIAVKAANGKGSRVDFTESANNSDDFESGYDVVKYMNEKSINLYATINGEDFSSVVTNNLIGKKLSLQTNGEIAYTMSFKNVEGVEYAIRDNATNQIIAIEEGATYEFAAQPNSVIEGRFEIVDRANAPTAIENTEVKANVKGIYTIMGQYLGEDFDILPAGVYVVDGVKIVK